jgi:hypothetical protein
MRKCLSRTSENLFNHGRYDQKVAAETKEKWTHLQYRSAATEARKSRTESDHRGDDPPREDEKEKLLS